MEGIDIYMGNHDAVIEKVRKLLNMANCKNVNEHEGQTAIVKAQLLLKKHNLSMADIDTDLADDKDVVDMAITKFSLHDWWQKSLAHIIANNFRCTAYIQDHSRYSKIFFIGLKEDVDVAEQIYIYAEIHMKETGHQAYRFEKRNQYSKNMISYLDNYYRGYLKGLNDKFEEQMVKEEGLELVLVKSPKVIEAVAQKGLLDADKITLEHVKIDKGAYTKGYKTGRDFDQEKKSIDTVLSDTTLKE